VPSLHAIDVFEQNDRVLWDPVDRIVQGAITLGAPRRRWCTRFLVISLLDMGHSSPPNSGQAWILWRTAMWAERGHSLVVLAA
jgi:hypothetical protein